MAKAAQVYECHNKACPLGTVNPWTPGRFTGGLAGGVLAKLNLGLKQSAADGEGICPNCGSKGEAV